MHTEANGKEGRPQEQPVNWVKISDGLIEIFCIHNITKIYFHVNCHKSTVVFPN